MRTPFGLFALAVALLASPPVAAGAPARSDEEDASYWCTTFYAHQRVAELPSVLGRLDAAGVFDRPHARAPMAAFLSRILARPDVRAEALVREAKVGAAGRPTLLDGLWMAGQGPRAVRLAEAWKLDAERYRAKPPDLHSMPLREPGDFDRLWGAFMATGDVAYPRRLIDFLDMPEPFRPGEPQWSLLSGTARWSLQSNAKQHKAVLGLLTTEAARRTGPARPVLDSILQELQRERR
jgi:hypothetical protein